MPPAPKGWTQSDVAGHVRARLRIRYDPRRATIDDVPMEELLGPKRYTRSDMRTHGERVQHEEEADNARIREGIR